MTRTHARYPLTLGALALVSLIAALPLTALGKKLPVLDRSSEEALLATAADYGFEAIGKWGKGDPSPTKVGVTKFQVRYDLRTVTTTSGFADNVNSTYKYLEFDDAQYQKMTDGIYTAWGERLKAAGVEVLAQEVVTGDAGWRDARGQDEPKESARRVVFAPTGYKIFALTANPEKIHAAAWVNEAAAVDVSLVFGLCDLRGNEKEGVGGVRVCLKGTTGAGVPGLEVNVATAVAQGKFWKILSTMLVRKLVQEVKPGDYGMKGDNAWVTGPGKGAAGALIDLPLIHDEAVMPKVSSSWWSGPEYDADATAFADAVAALNATALDITMAHWKRFTAGQKWSAGKGTYN